MYIIARHSSYSYSLYCYLLNSRHQAAAAAAAGWAAHESYKWTENMEKRNTGRGRHSIGGAGNR